jgi:hypothetical protein
MYCRGDVFWRLAPPSAPLRKAFQNSPLRPSDRAEDFRRDPQLFGSNGDPTGELCGRGALSPFPHLTLLRARQGPEARGV